MLFTRNQQCQLLIGVAIVVAVSGCSTTDYVKRRSEPFSPLNATLNLLSYRGPKPTARTESLLRSYGIEDYDIDDLGSTLDQLQQEIAKEPTLDNTYAFAELAYIHGKTLEPADQSEALDYYRAAVAHAYLYLFDERFDARRNAYDPNFRGACELYNGALEASLRIAQREGTLRPGQSRSVEVAGRRMDVTVVNRGTWHDDDFARLEFVSDYDVEGLANRHRTYGLGVPLIGVRKSHKGEAAIEQFYPPALSFAVTAFLRVAQNPYLPADQQHRGAMNCVLELYDPLTANQVAVGKRMAPLETDLSTPLAYFLDDSSFKESQYVATLGLLNPNITASSKGLYMLEPYDPQKIPVLMVHGLWSSPLTWIDMFNDLRAHPEIRETYQFWFYLYPTGQPFWISAVQLRQDLEETRRVLDPDGNSPTMHQLVMVGHSMGGLVSRLQTLESGDDFWHILSDRPFTELQADEETRQRVARAVFFQPNPAIRRVVTLGTPHRGSDFANKTTRWLSRKLITLPFAVSQIGGDLVRENPDFFRNTDLLTSTTSIDSLAPESPILPVMEKARRAPWVTYHNVIGIVSGDGLAGRFAGGGDGVVSYESARVGDAVSEITVPSDHVSIHKHPIAIREVRRILLEHHRQYLAERMSRHTTPATYVR